jgi:predicted nucleic acid-binding protein
LKVLDTNVVSELMRLRPEPLVLAWVDAQEPSGLWLTSTIAAELLFGVARLPDGARRRQLAVAVAGMLEQDFAGRVLAFDLSAASVYAQMVADRERSGYGMAMADAQIAATCVAHGATLVTRNQRHFEGWGLPLIDPWQGAAAAGR